MFWKGVCFQYFQWCQGIVIKELIWKRTEEIHICKVCKSSTTFWTSNGVEGTLDLVKLYIGQIIFSGEGMKLSFFTYNVIIIKMRSDKYNVTISRWGPTNVLYIVREEWSKFGQNFSFCGGHKWITPKWKDYRNLCKDLKFLICALYVSKVFSTDYLSISDLCFVAGLQVIFFFCFCFCFEYIYLFYIYIYIPTTSLILRFTIYISLCHIPKYTLRKVIISHYRFLSSKAYQKRYYVIETHE